MRSKVYDAILVLGLKLNKNGEPTDELIARARLAARCYLRGSAPLVIPCGGQTEDTPCTEASVMARIIEQEGVPKEAIAMEDKSLVTYENIRNARMIIKQRCPPRLRSEKPHVLIVTSDYHLFRAKHIARSMGFKAGGCAFKTPDNKEKCARRKKERYYLVNYVLGWETGRRKRPKWYDAAVKRLK